MGPPEVPEGPVLVCRVPNILSGEAGRPQGSPRRSFRSIPGA